MPHLRIIKRRHSPIKQTDATAGDAKPNIEGMKTMTGHMNAANIIAAFAMAVVANVGILALALN